MNKKDFINVSMKVVGLSNIIVSVLAMWSVAFFDGTERLGILGVYLLIIGLKLLDNTLKEE